MFTSHSKHHLILYPSFIFYFKTQHKVLLCKIFPGPLPCSQIASQLTLLHQLLSHDAGYSHINSIASFGLQQRTLGRNNHSHSSFPLLESHCNHCHHPKQHCTEMEWRTSEPLGCLQGASPPLLSKTKCQVKTKDEYRCSTPRVMNNK